MTRLSLLSSIWLSAVSVLGACAPEYRSGMTGCAAGSCPAGFECVNKVCYLPSDRPGGVSATDAAPVPVGNDGGAPRAPDASPAVTRDSCRAPTPIFCEARGGVPASCQRDRLDCATAISCPDGVRACRKDAVASCQYRADYCDGRDPVCTVASHPVRCPAMGDIGPGCWTPNTDCSSRKACGDEIYSRACAPGQTVDCRYRVDSCTPGRPCSDAFPKSCPGMGEIGPDECWTADIDCSTRVYCEADGAVIACPAGGTPDCKYDVDYCFPTETCAGDFPQLCPALDRFGPGCWGPNTDCSTRTVCDDRPRVRSCAKGFKVDCNFRVDYCVPVAGPACPNPMFPLLCPALRDLGPTCFRDDPGAAAIDCNGRKVCGDELDATTCRVGSVVDCTRPAGMRCVTMNPRPDGGSPPDAGADGRPGGPG
jgi:hypothetical protein